MSKAMMENLRYISRTLRISLIGVLTLGWIASDVRADDTIFDSDIIRARGFDPQLAAQFREGTRFLSGESRVSLVLNGRDQGKVTARFGDRGQLCVTEMLLRQANLKAPAWYRLTSTGDDCVAIDTLWPQGIATPYPDENQLALVLPEEALSAPADYEAWEHGGRAGVLNYNGQYLASHASTSDFNFWQVQSEAGFNAGDWVVRSNQTWNQFSHATRFQHQSAWVQRTLYDFKSQLRAGRFALTGSGVSVGRIQGVQLTPEAALYKNAGAAVVTGIAATPSVVEIRQQGVLLYSTTVPDGPFTLKGFALLNTRSDLQITQIGSDGNRRQYTIPAAAYLTGGSTVTPGVAWGIGRWDQEGTNAHPFITSLSTGWQALSRAKVQTDLLYSPRYRALGMSSAAVLPAGQTLALSTIWMSDTAHQGTQSTLAVDQSLGDSFAISLNAAHQSAGYREFGESIMHIDVDPRNRNQYGPEVSGYHELLGSLSLSWTRSTLSDRSHSDYVQLGWSRQFGENSLSLTAGRNNGGLNNRREDAVYITWQIPLGERSSVSAWLNQTDQNSRYGSRFRHRQGADRQWALSVEHDRHSANNAFSAGLDQLTPWNRINGTFSYDTGHYRSLSLQSSGAVVLHHSGVLLTPYRVADTFGVVQVGQQKNVRVETASGSVTTNADGYAVLPSLPAWRTSALRLDTTSLGKTADVANAWEELAVTRGSVSQVSFRVITTRRVLVSVQDPVGNPFPARANLYDLAGNFVTVSGENGTAFIPDAQPGMSLKAEAPAQETCTLTLTDLPTSPPENTGLYETTRAICQP